MSFPIFGIRKPPAGTWKVKATIAAGACGRCDGPVAATLTFVPVSTNSDSSFENRVMSLLKPDAKMDELGFVIEDTWPSAPLPEAPPSLPQSVERAFIQAERNRMMPDCEEAAATMYRRSLDLALKEAFPDEKGTLDGKLKKLVKDKRLPDAIGEWAHEVRLIGNDGAHDVDGVTADELADARALIDTVLKYLFTLPAQIAARRPVQLATATT